MKILDRGLRHCHEVSILTASIGPFGRCRGTCATLLPWNRPAMSAVGPGRMAVFDNVHWLMLWLLASL